MGGGLTHHRQSFETSVPFLLADADYTMEDIAFLDAVRNQTMPESGFVQATKVNALVDRIHASAQRR